MAAVLNPLHGENPKPDTKLPHPHDPVLQTEHLQMLDLVRDADVTHTATRDGAWSDKATWRDGKLPTEGANVFIPKGKTITLDHVSAVALRTVRVNGALHFAPDRDTGLLVDTIVVAPDASLVIGTVDRPIAADRRATLTFADRGPIDTGWDPTLLSRGLVAHGTVSFHGAAVTPFVALTVAPEKGATRLTLPRRPDGWKVGDRLLLTGTGLERNEDEELELQALSGTEVRVSPIRYRRELPAEGLSVYLANLSRNVVLQSQNTRDISRAGHIMFMHSPEVSVANTAFLNLGRTDKRKPVNDPKLDHAKKLLGGTGLNPRGRYAVHFHRTGVAGCADPAQVRGSVVVNSPGWGFVNHSSNVDMQDNVAFNVAGAAFVTEAGDEIGSFRRNLAVRSVGSGEDVDSRRKLQDFGHEGDGFWFQGGGVTVEHNIACGQAQTGFIFFTSGLEQEGLGKTKFLAANLQDKTWTGGKKAVEVGQVPVRSFKGNIAFASHTGFIPRFHLSGPKDGGPRCPGASVFEDSVVWNTRIGVHIRYSSHITLRNLRLISSSGEKRRGYAGVLGQIEEVNRIRCENLHVEGWRSGVDVRESGSWVIEGGSYNNHVNIMIPTTIERGRVVEITGDIRFAKAGQEPGHYDIYLGAEFKTSFQGRDPNRLFVPDIVKYQGKQLYYLEQAADYVPLRKKVAPAEEKTLGSAEGSVPEELIGKTNREMWEKYGLAIAGTVAPADAIREPRIHGLVGNPAKYPEPEIVHHSTKSAELKGFKLVCTGVEKKPVAEGLPTDLRKGWNLITLTVEDNRRSFLIFGGDAAAAGGKYGKKDE